MKQRKHACSVILNGCENGTLKKKKDKAYLVIIIEMQICSKVTETNWIKWKLNLKVLDEISESINVVFKNKKPYQLHGYKATKQEGVMRKYA